MRRTNPSLVLTLLVAMLLFTGCELSGNYHGDNVDVQFGNTNVGAQTHTQ